MKQLILFVGWMAYCLSLFAQAPALKPTVIYDVFEGDYADPSIVREGKDFYMTHSTTNLLIWHSTDLLHWKPVSRALPNTTSGMAWAPEIIKHNNRFYIYYPLHGKIYVTWAAQVAGPWSEPIDLNADGIDPGVITAANGKRYLYINDGKVAPLSDDGLSLGGKLEKNYDGWQYPKHWAVECFCLESPKLIKKNNYYYMISAQGGTSGPSTSHMAVVARSVSPVGPWENSPYNPLVHTDTNTDPYISKGHGTLFDDAQGNWYITYHAYKRNERALGRHTLIEKIKWTPDGWPVQYAANKTPGAVMVVDNTTLSSELFTTGNLNLQWMVTNADHEQNLIIRNNGVELTAKNGKLSSLQAMIPYPDFEATIKFDGEGGLSVYYNDEKYIGLTAKADEVTAIRDDKPEPSVLVTGVKYIKLKMNQFDLSLLYSTNGTNWATYPHSYDVSGYQTNILRNFGSLRIAAFVKGAEKLTIKSFSFKKL